MKNDPANFGHAENCACLRPGDAMCNCGQIYDEPTPADESGAEVEGVEWTPEMQRVYEQTLPKVKAMVREQPRAAAQEIVAAFERWARPQFSGDEVFDRIEDRPTNALGLTWEYNGHAVQAAWSAWIECARLAQPAGDLEAAARKVCWFDWSENDGDAVAAINALRIELSVIDAARRARGAE